MTKTPEGFLICRNVPIARLGTQKYLPSEIGLTGDGLVPVHRNADEVFSAAAIASFEGKPVTLEHPPVTVTPENVGAYQKGHAQNVHRGSGEDADLLIADLFITDSDLIRQIEDGLREVSCGYECEYAQDNTGRINQCRIRGNHVAVVAAGRAGSRVSIKDSAPEPIKKGAKKKMAKKPSVFSHMVAHWAKDAEPEEVASVIDEMLEDPDEQPTATDADEEMEMEEEPVEEGMDEDPTAPTTTPATAPVAPETTDSDEEIKTLLKQVLAKLSGQPDPTADPIDLLTDEIAGATDPAADPNAAPVIPEEDEDPSAIPAIGEKEVSVPPEQLGDADVEEVAAMQAEKDPGMISKDSAIAMLNAMKPYLNKLPKNDRRACADSMTRAYRRAAGRAETPAYNGYAGIMNVRRAAAKKRMGDRKAVDETELGRSIMAKKNPHYKK